MTDTARERREYILDAWADVAVTLAFAVAAVIAGLAEHLLEHLPVPVEITLKSLEFGGMLAVINHVVMILWSRTLIGSSIKWLITRAVMDDRGPDDPGTGAAGEHDGTRQIETDSEPLSKDGGTANRSTQPVRWSVQHPAPGRAGQRAGASMFTLFLGAVFSALYLTVSEYASQRAAAISVTGVVVYYFFTRGWAHVALAGAAIGGLLHGLQRKKHRGA